jgi:hypothetical protein
MSGFTRKPRLIGAPPRPARPVLSTTMGDQLGRRLQLICADLGCLAIEARALWNDGGVDFLGTAEAGAAEGDVLRLKRLRTPPAGERRK